MHIFIVFCLIRVEFLFLETKQIDVDSDKTVPFDSSEPKPVSQIPASPRHSGTRFVRRRTTHRQQCPSSAAAAVVSLRRARCIMRRR